MISVTILTKNSQKYLREVLESLKDFSEVVVYDTGSTDETFKIAESFPNVKIYKKPFIGFGPTHNQASSVARYDWILSIDSDEVVSSKLAKEILNLPLDPHSVYSFPRHNYYNERFIKGCGWYPDRQIRLYNRAITHFSNAMVHESIISNALRHVELKNPIKHYSYDTVADFLTKMQMYSSLFAEQNKGKKSSPLKAVLHAFFAFFKSYILKRGFLDGYEGFSISVYNANTAFYKYLKLYEANSRESNRN